MRVVNASPLIVLSKLGRLDLLREPRPDIEVVTPRAVLDEVLKGKPEDPAVTLVPQAPADWLRVLPTPPIPGVFRTGDLDRGRSPSSPSPSNIRVGRWCSMTIPRVARRPGWVSRASVPSAWS